MIIIHNNQRHYGVEQLGRLPELPKCTINTDMCPLNILPLFQPMTNAADFNLTPAHVNESEVRLAPIAEPKTGFIRYGDQTAFQTCMEVGSSMVSSEFAKHSFKSMLQELSILRYENAREQRTSSSKEFGEPRLSENSRLKNDQAFTSIREETYGQYVGPLEQFLVDHQDQNGHFTHQYMTQQQEVLNLTTLENRQTPTDALIIRHTSTQVLGQCLDELSSMYESLKPDLTPQADATVVDRIANFVYLFDHAMPVKRGGSSIGEMFAKGMLQRAGLEVSTEQVKGLDFLAFVNNQSNFPHEFKVKLGIE